MENRCKKGFGLTVSNLESTQFFIVIPFQAKAAQSCCTCIWAAHLMCGNLLSTVICLCGWFSAKSSFGFQCDLELFQRCFTFLCTNRYACQVQLSPPAAESGAQAKAGLRSWLFMCVLKDQKEILFPLNKWQRLWVTVEGIMVPWSHIDISLVQRTPSSYSSWGNW